MTQVLTITQLGNPILEQKAAAIDNLLDADCQNLIDSLITTVQAAHGVGIAAPQVARSLRLFIVASHPNPGWEGCLSVPNWRGFVPRHQWIEVAYYDRNGREIRQVFRDFVARIFQHEYDHLEGILFLDRLASPADLYSEEEYHKIRNIAEYKR